MYRQSKFFLLIKFVILFFLLYDVNFSFLPSITTSRLAFLALFLLNLPLGFKFRKSLFPYIGIFIFIIAISGLQNFSSGDFSQTSRLLWLSIYGLLSPFLFIRLVKDKNELFWMALLTVLLQSFLTIASFTIPSVKALYYSIIIFTSNYDEELLLRASGFASIGGAGFSVIQSIGVICGLLLLRFNKNLKFSYKVIVWLAISVITISTFVIGRTGLFICILSILTYFLSIKISFKTVFVSLAVIASVALIDINSLVESATGGVQGFDTTAFIDWIVGAFDFKDNVTREELSDMPVPPLSLETLIGTGLVKDPSGFGNASGNDSGYIQTYYALGLIMCIFFYVSYLLFLFHQIKTRWVLLCLLVLLMYIMENKESFIFQYVFPFFVLSLILIFNRDIQEASEELVEV